VTFALGGKEFKNTFLMCQLPTDAAGRIGADFLEEASAIVSFDSCELMIPHGRYDPASGKTRPRNAPRIPCLRRVKRVAFDSFGRRRGRGLNRSQPTLPAKFPPLKYERGL
jgi:hypothetical protein